MQAIMHSKPFLLLLKQSPQVILDVVYTEMKHISSDIILCILRYTSHNDQLLQVMITAFVDKLNDMDQHSAARLDAHPGSYLKMLPKTYARMPHAALLWAVLVTRIPTQWTQIRGVVSHMLRLGHPLQ